MIVGNDERKMSHNCCVHQPAPDCPRPHSFSPIKTLPTSINKLALPPEAACAKWRSGWGNKRLLISLINRPLISLISGASHPASYQPSYWRHDRRVVGEAGRDVWSSFMLLSHDSNR